MPLEIHVPIDGKQFGASLETPSNSRGVVIFAHGSGSSRHSPRNQFVARTLNERGFATLLLDLLTADEDAIDARTSAFRFDIALLARRVGQATSWTLQQPQFAGTSIGYFGASTGAAASLLAAASREDVRAVVSRGGRPDLAGSALREVTSPTLLIVGGSDTVVIGLNEVAKRRMTAPCEIAIVPKAGHLFEEPGALEAVSKYAGEWFTRYL